MYVTNISKSYQKNKMIKLSLLPGVKVRGGYYTVNMQLYSYDDDGALVMIDSSANMYDDNFNLSFECNVKEISYIIRCHNSFPQTPFFDKRFHFRVDDLMLLNIAVKLLGKSKKKPFQPLP